MFKDYKLAFVLFLLTFISGTASGSELVFKLLPEYRQSLSSSNSSLSLFIQEMSLPEPQRHFPFHQTPRMETGMLGKPLTDLSLIYRISVPEPMSTIFLLNQLKKRPEFQYVEWIQNDAIPLSMPNDPSADSTIGNQRQLFRRIQAYQAWNLSQGDTNVVIGVLDTGIPVDHEDMISQIKINPLDPPNGIDDDQNGLIDDYRGWDFGSNDNNATPDNTATAPGHGTSVAGLAGAGSNNAKGVSGLAWNCKILPLKVWKWAGTFSNFKGYEAIVYAADHGCKVINCSWGSARSNVQYEQDIINYATFNKGALIVAAGGNTAGFYNFLPANYDYVMGVAMTDTTDKIVTNSSQNFKLDLMAPGINLYGIKTDGSYGWVDGGSSMASPLVAGAAALVRSRFPELTGVQAGELLRVNSDTVYSVPGNVLFRDRLGRGRLNVYKALQKLQSKSIRAVDIQIRNKQGAGAIPGDSVGVYVRYENYLDSLNGFSATIYSSNPAVQFYVNNQSYSGIGSMQSRVEANPFLAVISPTLVVPADVNFRVDVNSGTYHDQRWFTVHIDQRMLDLDVNQVRITVVNNGRLGSTDVSAPQGRGIQYRNVQHCGEAGLMVGTGPSQVSNCVFDTTGYDLHFRPENAIRYLGYPGIDQHATVHLNDSAAGALRLGLGIKETAFEFTSAELQGSVFLNYQITNRSLTGFDSICVAQYNDWEVENFNLNRAGWVDSLRLGYTTGKVFRNRYAATQILSSGEPQYYAVEALPNTNNGNINLFDGFAISEKWKMMSSGIGRPSAGIGNGNNVVQVTGVKLRNMSVGETRKVTFAYVFADSLPQLVERAKANLAWFRKHNTSSTPLPRKSRFCSGDSVLVSIANPDGVQQFKVSSDSIQSQVLYQGNLFSGTIYSDSSLFVSGCDSLYPGPTVRWQWESAAVPASAFTISPLLPGDTLAVDSSVTVMATDTGSSVHNQWYVNNMLQADTSLVLSLGFDTAGTYEICLEQSIRNPNCSTRVCKTIRTFTPLGVKYLDANDFVVLYPNPVKGMLNYKTRSPFHLKIYDVMGRRVFSGFVEDLKGQIPVGDIPSGVFHYTLLSNGIPANGNLIIE